MYCIDVKSTSSSFKAWQQGYMFDNSDEALDAATYLYEANKDALRENKTTNKLYYRIRALNTNSIVWESE